jgi:archaellum biogenesis ATPase FlaH
LRVAQIKHFTTQATFVRIKITFVTADVFTAMREIEPDEDLSEPGRYNSADNWDPYKKHRKAAAKLTRDFLAAETPSPFRQLNGDELAKTPAPIKEPKQLFGSLWREGEVAILFGETATGKSILATQIAESIARGINVTRPPKAPLLTKEGWQSRPESGLTGWFSPEETAKAQPVLYFDLERTLAQFQERYSIRRSPTSDRRIKYKFFRNFNRLDLAHIDDAANDIKGDLNLFCRNAIRRQIEQNAARVVIIDNISYLSRATSNSAGASLIKTLKLWANLYNVSILAVAHKPDRGRPRPLSLADLPPYASLADTVFAIAKSSMAPDIRYIKHLKWNAGTPAGTDTLTLRLERLSEPGAIATGFPHSPDSSLPSPVSTNPQSAIQNPPSDAPYLGLTYLGHSAEAEHLRDYEREARDAHNREQKRLRQWHRSSKEALIQGYFDGSYARYLKGE